MNQSLGENEDLSLLDRFRDKNVTGCYETDVQLAFQDEHDLGGAWMRVWRVQTAGSVVDSGKGDAECVQTGD
ncbi:hypothetical protein IC575_012069 [Cucumis melo]